MKHLFVPYELALKLKEKGFDEPCYGCRITVDNLFKNNDDVHVYSEPKNYNNWNGRLSAPLYQQVIDWFREKHKIDIYIDRHPKSKNVFEYFHVRKTGDGFNSEPYFSGWFNTYYEALNKAIEEALKLIP